jgi:hypothetical protein
MRSASAMSLNFSATWVRVSLHDHRVAADRLRIVLEDELEPEAGATAESRRTLDEHPAGAYVHRGGIDALGAVTGAGRPDSSQCAQVDALGSATLGELDSVDHDARELAALGWTGGGDALRRGHRAVMLEHEVSEHSGREPVDDVVRELGDVRNGRDASLDGGNAAGDDCLVVAVDVDLYALMGLWWSQGAAAWFAKGTTVPSPPNTPMIDRHRPVLQRLGRAVRIGCAGCQTRCGRSASCSTYPARPRS